MHDMVYANKKAADTLRKQSLGGDYIVRALALRHLTTYILHQTSDLAISHPLSMANQSMLVVPFS